MTAAGSDRPACIGVGGRSGSSRSMRGRTPVGGDRLRPRRWKGSTTSSSSCARGGNGRGDGRLIGFPLGPGLPVKPRAAVAMTRPSCDLRAPPLPASRSLLGPFGSDARWSSSSLPVTLDFCVVRRLAMSEFVRFRLALVGEAKDGRRGFVEVALASPAGADGSRRSAIEAARELLFSRS